MIEQHEAVPPFWPAPAGWRAVYCNPDSMEITVRAIAGWSGESYTTRSPKTGEERYTSFHHALVHDVGLSGEATGLLTSATDCERWGLLCAILGPHEADLDPDAIRAISNAFWATS